MEQKKCKKRMKLLKLFEIIWNYRIAIESEWLWFWAAKNRKKLFLTQFRHERRFGWRKPSMTHWNPRPKPRSPFGSVSRSKMSKREFFVYFPLVYSFTHSSDNRLRWHRKQQYLGQIVAVCSTPFAFDMTNGIQHSRAGKKTQELWQ